MTQDSSSQPTVMEHTLEPLLAVEAPVQLPDVDADHLMDEIFGEVEQVLDGSLIPPDEPVTIGGRASTHFDIIEALGERYGLHLKPLEASIPPELPGPDKALSRRAGSRRRVQSQATTGLSLLERFMIFTGCASAVGALAIWLISQGLIGRGISYVSQTFTADPSATTPAAVPVGSPVDATFSEYMLRSLAAIERETPINSSVATAPIATIGTGTENATVTIPPPISPLQLNQLTTPTKKTNQVAVKPIDSAAKPGNAGATPQDLVTRTELNQVMNRLSVLLEGRAPGTTDRAAPNSTAQSKPAKPPIAQSAVVTSQPQRRINGVVEWGDKSVVTFEYNGATQRVYLGEVVGNTGWTLVNVQGNQATFRKNGKFRNLSDGESF